MIFDFNDDEMDIFDELMEVVKRHPDFKKYEVRVGPALRLPGLEIYPERREIYRDRREVSLTAKEFDILCFLAANRGRVMTYGQIYEQVWGGYMQDMENNTVGCHICHLKEKLFAASPCSSFNIRCVRDIGYCFEIIPGSDEYIQWPKTAGEGIAGCHALARHFTDLSQPDGKPVDILSCGSLAISLHYHKVLIPASNEPSRRALAYIWRLPRGPNPPQWAVGDSADRQEVKFPRREFDLFYLLASNPGRVFTFKQLSQEVWGGDYEITENSLHSCIRRIRRKLENAQGNSCRIENIRGVGYCFRQNET